MAEYRFKNAQGVEITTKDASAANEMRLSPNYTEVVEKAAKAEEKGKK